MKGKKRVIAQIIFSIMFSTLLFIEVFANDKEMSDYFSYNSTKLNLEEGELEGYFSNSSDYYDIYEITEANITVKDSDGKKVFSVNLDEDMTKKIKLKPGDTWDYTLKPQGLELRASDYNFKDGFSSQLLCSFKYKAHEEERTDYSDDPYARGFDNVLKNYEKELEKIDKEEASCDTSPDTLSPPVPSKNKKGNSQSVTRPTLSVYKSTEAVDKKCRKCGGTGKVRCEKCGGSGRVSITKDSINLGGNSRTYQYQQVMVCPLCGGKKETVCSACLGDGKQ